MNRHIRGSVFAVGLILILGSIFLANNDNTFLHAQDGNGVITYVSNLKQTGDPSYTGDPVPDNTKLITITINPKNNQTIKSLKVMVNGKDYAYSASDFNNGVLTMSVSKTDTQIIDFTDDENYFEPSYIMLNEENPDVVDNYNLNAFKGKERYLVECVARDSKGNEKETFDSGETAYITLTATKPMTVLYYKGRNGGGPKGNHLIYDKPFTKKHMEVGFAIMFVEYNAVRYYPGEEPPTADYDFGEYDDNWPREGVGFRGTPSVVPTPDPDPDPSSPTFKDKDGNMFEEKDVKLDIATLKNIDSFKSAITAYPEFTSIPTNQISYLDISVLAGTTKVQPLSKYSFVIPYPTGSTKDHEFVVYHFKNDDVKQPEKLNHAIKSDGLHVSVDGFSPFVVGWKEKAVTPPVPDNPKSDEKVENTVTDNINTGDASSSLSWLIVLSLAVGVMTVQGVRLYQQFREE